MKDAAKIKEKVKDHQKKEKKMYSLWKKIGILFGFNKQEEDILEEATKQQKEMGKPEEEITIADKLTK